MICAGSEPALAAMSFVPPGTSYSLFAYPIASCMMAVGFLVLVTMLVKLRRQYQEWRIARASDRVRTPHALTAT